MSGGQGHLLTRGAIVADARSETKELHSGRRQRHSGFAPDKKRTPRLLLKRAPGALTVI